MKHLVRNSNIELYRIFVMLSIVAHHYVVHSGLIRGDGGTISWCDFSFHNIFFLLFGMWGKTGINCFVLITGYFMCTSHITIRKFLKLILQIEFYNITIAFLFIIFYYHSFSWNDFFLQLLPITEVGSNFTGCYILFWLLIPFLNIIIQGINEIMHKRLITLCLFIYTAMLYIGNDSVSMNYVSWFIVLYFISSYIRLYPEKIYKCNCSEFWGWCSLFAIMLSIVSVINITWHNSIFYETRILNPYLYLTDCNAILALIVSVTTFMFFKNITIPQSKIINAIAATTFGVFLIHDNCQAMRQWLWHDVVDLYGQSLSLPYYFYVPMAVILIFITCSTIDCLRINTLEKWLFNYFDKKILSMSQ